MQLGRLFWRELGVRYPELDGMTDAEVDEITTVLDVVLKHEHAMAQIEERRAAAAAKAERPGR